VVQAEGQLECLPVVISFEMEVLPGERTVRKEGEFQVRVANRSEAGLSVQLSAADEAGACDYRFERRRVSLGPEETKRVPLTVAARETPSRGETMSHTFSVKATPADAAHLARTATGRLEVVRPRRLGVLAWSIIGFALGRGLMPALSAARLHPMRLVRLLRSPWATNALHFTVMGAVGGLLLGIGVGRRVARVCLAGALGSLGGGLLLTSGVRLGLAGSAVYGAVVGGLLGLALNYRWRAVGVVTAGGTLGSVLQQVVWSSVGFRSYLQSPRLQIVWVVWQLILGGLLGLMLGLAVLVLERRSDRHEFQSLPEPAES
jgi:hypothetical protein